MMCSFEWRQGSRGLSVNNVDGGIFVSGAMTMMMGLGGSRSDLGYRNMVLTSASVMV